MELLDADVDWFHDSDNLPILKATVDKLPSRSAFRYERITLSTGTFYWAESDDLVSFFFHDPKDQKGYGGAPFDLALATGGRGVLIKGPWSSSEGFANSLPMVPHSVYCRIKEKGGKYPDLPFACSITLDFAKKVATRAGIYLIEVRGREPTSEDGRLSGQQRLIGTIYVPSTHPTIEPGSQIFTTLPTG